VFGVGGAVALPVEPISTTVDDAQIPTKRFATDVVVRKVTIDTEQVKSIETGSMNNVSSVEIWLER
jgi:DNA-binding protein Alba